MTEDAHPGVSRSQFIRLGAALGVGAAASSALAACGGGEGGSGGGSGGSSEGSGGEESVASGEASQAPAPEETAAEQAREEQQGAGSSGGGQAIAQESAVAPGSAVPFEDGGNDAVLVHLQSGEFVAYSAVCTHQGCTVAYRDAQLVCPCHGSIFDPANGAEVLTGPAQTPLPEIPVEVRGGGVFKA